ncbi:hypothetical protein [Alkalicoccus chagannorensis]|uniref:hypothetical protein n=1 Tax=Alkalicoccus chagannorensis TaxID=427072 RepID=UPI0003F680A1|nr:hypothetical protein [Alkalicoccus chagannorensis]
MTYFVDHAEQRVHLSLCAGDRCGFNSTPAHAREFTNSEQYVTSLIQQGFLRCEQCESMNIMQK